MDKNEILNMLKSGVSVDDVATKLTSMLNEAQAVYTKELEAQKGLQEKKEIIADMLTAVVRYADLCGVDIKDLMNEYEITEELVKDIDQTVVSTAKFLKGAKKMTLNKSDDEIFDNFFKALDLFT